MEIPRQCSNQHKDKVQLKNNSQNGNQTKEHRREKIHRKRFSLQEDEKLLKLVLCHKQNLQYMWNNIALNMKGRSARQCRERYQLFLNKGARKKEKWTKKEDELLISKYDILGPHWKMMETFFEGRTSYDIKNRYMLLMRPKNNKIKQNSNDKGSNVTQKDELEIQIDFDDHSQAMDENSDDLSFIFQ